MARKLRIQYEGALYHVINRGNYRWDVFGMNPQANQSTEKTSVPKMIETLVTASRLSNLLKAK